MSRWPAVALALLIDGLAGLAGGVLSERWVRRHTSTLVGFAAGALLAAAFLDLFPEAAAELGPRFAMWSFAGFLAIAAFEWLLDAQRHEHASRGRGALPRVLLASDAAHNIADGAALAASFVVSPRVGLVTAVAVIAHEVPQEIGDYALLRRAGWNRRDALRALVAVQLTAVLGAAGVAVASEGTALLAPRIVAIAAGGFLYIGAADLLPELRATAQPRERLGPALGVLIGIGVTILAMRL